MGYRIDAASHYIVQGNGSAVGTGKGDFVPANKVRYVSGGGAVDAKPVAENCRVGCVADNPHGTLSGGVAVVPALKDHVGEGSCHEGDSGSVCILSSSVYGAHIGVVGHGG